MRKPLEFWQMKVVWAPHVEPRPIDHIHPAAGLTELAAVLRAKLVNVKTLQAELDRYGSGRRRGDSETF